MKKILFISISLLFITACKKEKKNDTSLDIANPMTDKKGWNLAKHTPDFYVYKNTIGCTNSIDLVAEHADGIDVLYSSIFQFQSELRIYNVRWRAFNSKDHDVKKVIINESVNQDPVGRPIISGLVNAYSRGMGENDLFAITQIDKRSNTYTDPAYYQYDYFNVNRFKNNINSTWFKFKNTQVHGGVGSANPNQPFACNGMNARLFNNPKNSYATGNFIQILGAAPKGNQLVMLAIRDSILYVLETNKSLYTHSSGSYFEDLNAVVIKNVYNLHQITKTSKENFIDISKFIYTENSLNVFLGLRNQKHRLLKINLNNYALSSKNESQYEKMDLTAGFFNVHLLPDRPDDMLSMEKDGIYYIANGNKTFIPSPNVKAETTVTNAYYSNGKIWQILFDTDGAYLINKAL